MLHLFMNDRPWFRAKQTGFGTGLPMAWQGWVLVASYIGAMSGLAGLFANRGGSEIVFYVLLLLVTAVFMLIARRKTEGGWRWRNGGK
jgi:hypothetical protein